jgi:hypothetical protein
MLPINMLPTVMQVISLLQEGVTLSSACDKLNVSTATVKRYVKDHPELTDAFRDAEQHGYDMMAEALLEIQSHPIYGTNVPAMASVISGNIKWFLARKRPDVYGEKVEHKVTITADREVMEALLRARERAQAREPLRLEPPTIDATIVDDSEPDISSLL